MRHAPRPEPLDPAAEEAEPGAALLALVEEELHADADAEHGPSVADARATSASASPRRLEAAGRRARVPDAGDHGERRLGTSPGSVETVGFAPARAKAEQTLRRLPAP